LESWIDNYFESLTKANTEGGRNEVLALKRANFPSALYRYRNLDRLAYRLDELREGYIFLNDPGDFNDPYDSALSTADEQFERLENRVLERYGYHNDPSAQSKFFESPDEEGKKEWRLEQEYKRSGFQDLFRGLLSLLYGPDACPYNQDLFSSFRNLVRVGCFTTNPNSVVMWSHYANQHTGICVEFCGSSMLSSEKFLKLVHPVRYVEKLFDLVQAFLPLIPEIDLDGLSVPTESGGNHDCWPILAACYKSKEWQYEKEWRLVSTDADHRKEPKFSLNACGIKPSRIILGTKIDRANRAAIKEIADKVSVPVIDAELAKNQFEIKF
jgi:hypothetical protein